MKGGDRTGAGGRSGKETLKRQIEKLILEQGCEGYLVLRHMSW